MNAQSPFPLKRILVIDDDDDLREAIGLTLERCGYDLSFAANGREALALLEQRGADLILLDMRMPVMNGWQFAREFRSIHGYGTPIVVLTAAADARRCAEEIGAEGWMAKPFELAMLIETVGTFTGSRGHPDSAQRKIN